MRPGLTTLAVGLAVLAIAEAGYIFYLRRRTSTGGGHVESRLDQLADALNLLTDTTESGLTALAVEVQRVQLRVASPRAGSRGAAGSRPSAARPKGAGARAKAPAETLSEDAAQLQAALAAMQPDEDHDLVRA